MKISNGILAIEVSTHGAELVSLKKGDREYMWCADPQYWNRHAPILFPAVGKPYRNQLHIGGMTCDMKQHGFARDSEFEAVGDGRLRMLDTGLSGQYPYRFALEADYRLNGRRVEITWTVTNLDDRDMHFQIGAHPGFMLPHYDAADDVHGFVHYYDSHGLPVSPVMVSALDEGCRVPRTPVVIPADMPIVAGTFAHDALIFEQGQVSTAELCDKQGRPVLSVSCRQAEAFGIWAPHKEGCPFVCLEPWCGICDPVGFTGDISLRDCSHSLAPNDHYCFTYIITIQ